MLCVRQQRALRWSLVPAAGACPRERWRLQVYGLHTAVRIVTQQFSVRM